MKILLDDGLQLSVGTGIGSYAKALGDALKAMPDTTLVREDFAPAGKRRRARLAYLSYISSATYRKKLQDFDVVHYANFAMPKKLPPHIVSATTVHDLAAFSHKSALSLPYALYNRFMIKRAVKRADVILAGACILQVIMDRLDADELTVSDRGLRHGLAWEILNQD